MTKNNNGGPVTIVERQGGRTAIAAVSVGYQMHDGWTNPNKDELMKTAGFKTAEEINKEN